MARRIFVVVADCEDENPDSLPDALWNTDGVLAVGDAGSEPTPEDLQDALRWALTVADDAD